MNLVFHKRRGGAAKAADSRSSRTASIVPPAARAPRLVTCLTLGSSQFCVANSPSRGTSCRMHPRANPTVYFTISDSPGDVNCAAHGSVTRKRGVVHPRFWFLRLGGAGANGCSCCAVALGWAAVAGLPLGLVVRGRPLLGRWPVGSPSHSLARGHLKHNVFDPPSSATDSCMSHSSLNWLQMQTTAFFYES